MEMATDEATKVVMVMVMVTAAAMAAAMAMAMAMAMAAARVVDVDVEAMAEKVCFFCDGGGARGDSHGGGAQWAW